MKLKTFIGKCIFAFPSLYYKQTYQESEIVVLCHTFLTAGNGIEYNKDGTFGGMQRWKVPRNCIKKLKAGKKIAKIAKKPKKFENSKIAQLIGIFPDYESGDEVTFLEDFLLTKQPYYEWGQIVKGIVEDLPVVSVYPDIKHQYPWHPYPFSLEYCPFYNRQTKKFIPKGKIQPDWREGIVYIFTAAKNWFASDKWVNNDYYNWGSIQHWKESNNIFLDNWNKKVSVEQLCKDYEIPFYPYDSAQKMADMICDIGRGKYIADCQRVIDFYS